MDPAPRAPHPRANLVLALGIAGLVCFGPLTGVPAWILGASAAAEIRREPARYENAGMVTAGMWLGVASTVLGVLMLVMLGVGAAIGFTQYLERAKAAGAAPVAPVEYVSKNGLVRAHYPADFAASSVDDGTVVLAHNLLATTGDEAVVLGAVRQPISEEPAELTRVIDGALLQNYQGYVESSRREATCLGGPGLETTGAFSFHGRQYRRWACTFVRDHKGYQFSYLVTEADAPSREAPLRAIVDATDLLAPGTVQ